MNEAVALQAQREAILALILDYKKEYEKCHGAESDYVYAAIEIADGIGDLSLTEHAGREWCQLATARAEAYRRVKEAKPLLQLDAENRNHIQALCEQWAVEAESGEQPPASPALAPDGE